MTQGKTVRTREEIETEMQKLLVHGVRGPNTAWSDVHRLFDEIRAYGAAEERGKVEKALLDPATVHQNLLRGGIAKLSWEQVKHLYPANFAAIEVRVKVLEEAITTLFDGQSVLENRGWGKHPDRVVLYDDERMASGKDPVDVAIRGAEQIRATLIREGGV